MGRLILWKGDVKGRANLPGGKSCSGAQLSSGSLDLDITAGGGMSPSREPQPSIGPT